MAPYRRFADWLETHWVVPAYSGWLMLGLAVFFFGAATNTLAGWLYVISGVMLALLAIAAVLPERSLRGIRVTRYPLEPISAGEPLQIGLAFENQTLRPKTLLEVQDDLPSSLGQPAHTAIETMPAGGFYRWLYECPTHQRGIYHWQTVQLRTATPLGLFWCRRTQQVNARAVVYPSVLPLPRCPLIDEVGRETNSRLQSAYRAQGATEGVTRTLRPYRWGDPTRLVHWRTSARYGELRVRELEVFTGGQELVICLDSAASWDAESFEQAVIAAASLYFYALHQMLQVSLWTAYTGVLKGDRQILEALAATTPEEPEQARLPLNLPLVWLSQHPESLMSLPSGSRWVLWIAQGRNQPSSALHNNHPGLILNATENLQLQLQASLRITN